MNLAMPANSAWRFMALLGAALIVVGVSAFYIDVAAQFRFDSIERYYDAFGVSILTGVVFGFIGCIGWAKSHDKKARASMAGIVFVAPWVLLLGGSPIDGINIHGPSMITVMLIFPATILAVLLLSMGPRQR